MVKYKLFPFRFLLFMIPAIFLGLIYKNAIFHLLFFDVNAPDLSHTDGVALKQEWLMSLVSINYSLFEFNFYQSILLPLTLIWLAYSYYFIKNRNLKYMIGKAKDYHQAIFLLKWQIAKVAVFFFLAILAVIIAVGVVMNQLDYPQLEMYFDTRSILSLFSRNIWLYLVYYALVKSLSLLTQTLFICFLVDFFQSFSKAALFYIFVMWGVAPVLYSFLPTYFVPMSNLMITSYGSINLLQIVFTYLPFLGIYLVLKVRKPYEVG